MADSSIFSTRRRKKRLIKARENNANQAVPGKNLVILSKPQAEKVNDPPAMPGANNPVNFPELGKPTEVVNKTKPTVILKSREHESAHRGSPPISKENIDQTGRSSSPTVSSHLPSSPTPTYQIAQSKHVHSSHEVLIENKLLPSTPMKSPVKLIDEHMQWSEGGAEFFLDQSDFYVIGVIGMQGVGKSSIMSMLANGRFALSERSNTFRIETKDHREVGEHATGGIDMYITSDRIILLDVQPVMSASVLERLLETDKRHASEFSSILHSSEIPSLQLMSFLYTVCHTVLVVQDWITDINLLKNLQTAEMLKPSLPSQNFVENSAEDIDDDYYPHIVFIYNKCAKSDYAPKQVQELQQVLSLVFYKSRLKYKGSVGMDRDNLIPSLCGLPSQCDMNLFMLPQKSKTSHSGKDILNDYEGSPGMDVLSNSLYRQIYSMPRSHITRISITEKDWFLYAAKSWDSIKKSNLNFFTEYGRVFTGYN